MTNFTRRLALLQAIYYVITGIWPLLSIRTFEAITGPKVDRWLVRLVGMLITLIGGVIGVAALRRRLTAEIYTLAIASAACFTAIDTIYAIRRRISLVYLLDALLEVGIIGGWIVGIIRSIRELRAPFPSRPFEE